MRALYAVAAVAVLLAAVFAAVDHLYGHSGAGNPVPEHPALPPVHSPLFLDLERVYLQTMQTQDVAAVRATAARLAAEAQLLPDETERARVVLYLDLLNRRAAELERLSRGGGNTAGLGPGAVAGIAVGTALGTLLLIALGILAAGRLVLRRATALQTERDQRARTHLQEQRPQSAVPINAEEIKYQTTSSPRADTTNPVNAYFELKKRTIEIATYIANKCNHYLSVSLICLFLLFERDGDSTQYTLSTNAPSRVHWNAFLCAGNDDDTDRLEKFIQFKNNTITKHFLIRHAEYKLIIPEFFLKCAGYEISHTTGKTCDNLDRIQYVVFPGLSRIDGSGEAVIEPPVVQTAYPFSASETMDEAEIKKVYANFLDLMYLRCELRQMLLSSCNGSYISLRTLENVTEDYVFSINTKEMSAAVTCDIDSVQSLGTYLHSLSHNNPNIFLSFVPEIKDKFEPPTMVSIIESRSSGSRENEVKGVVFPGVIWVSDVDERKLFVVERAVVKI